MNRRNFLRSFGAVSVLVAGGVVWRAYKEGVFSTGEGPAYQEWTDWEKDQSDGLLGLVHSALLAASPHNTQPWLFRMSESRIDLFADTERNLGAIDPYFREMYIGLGCALENLLLAAKANAYDYQLEYLPDASNASHVATINFENGEKTASALFHAIPHRHTFRGPHNLDKRVSSHTRNSMSMLGNEFVNVKLLWLEKQADRNLFFDLNAAATEELINDEEQSKASFKWFRNSWQELQNKKDGVFIDTTGISASFRAMAKILPPVSRETGDQYFLDAMKNLRDSSGMVGILVAKNSADNLQRVQGGRFWQRLHLWGTINDLVLQPINQIPERIDRIDNLGGKSLLAEKMQSLVNDTDWQVLMPFRMGYSKQPVFPSPRRHVKDCVI